MFRSVNDEVLNSGTLMVRLMRFGSEAKRISKAFLGEFGVGVLQDKTVAGAKASFSVFVSDSPSNATMMLLMMKKISWNYPAVALLLPFPPKPQKIKTFKQLPFLHLLT